MRAQISFEYMIIVGITLGAIIPAVFFIYSYVQTSNEDVIKTQINNIGKTLVDQATEVYALGEGNRATMRFNVPEEVKNISLFNGTELAIRHISKSGEGESVFFSDVPLRVQFDLAGDNCSITPCETGFITNLTYLQGGRKFQVESNGTFVMLRVIT
ncbi:MAG: hypothetical protein V1725_02455 [archaeon]